MHVTYELTADDYRRALIAHRNRNFLMRWLAVLLAFLLTPLGAIQIYLVFATPDQSWLRWALPLTILNIAVLLFIQWGAPYLNAKRQFRNTPSSHGQIELEVQDVGLRFRSVSTDGSVSWKHFIKWIEDESVFVLFSSPQIFVLIPKRAFGADQLPVFQQSLRQKIAT